MQTVNELPAQEWAAKVGGKLQDKQACKITEGEWWSKVTFAEHLPCHW